MYKSIDYKIHENLIILTFLADGNFNNTTSKGSLIFMTLNLTNVNEKHLYVLMDLLILLHETVAGNFRKNL